MDSILRTVPRGAYFVAISFSFENVPAANLSKSLLTILLGFSFFPKLKAILLLFTTIPSLLRKAIDCISINIVFGWYPDYIYKMCKSMIICNKLSILPYSIQQLNLHLLERSNANHTDLNSTLHL